MKMTKSLWSGIIFFVLTTLTGYYFYYQSTKSELIVTQEFPISLVKRPSELNDLQILFKDDTISSLSKVTLSIINNSNKPIDSSDFVTPFVIKFGDSISILTTEIASIKPKNINCSSKLGSSRSSIIVNFDLMNPNDELALDILYEGNLSKIEPYSRIKGIQNIEFTRRPQKLELWKFLSGYCITFLIFMFLMLLLVYKDKVELLESINILESSKMDLYKKYGLEDFLGTIKNYYPKDYKSFAKDFIYEVRQDEKPKSVQDVIVLLIEDLKDLRNYNFMTYLLLAMIIICATYLILVFVPLSLTGEPGILQNTYVWD